MNKKIMFMIFSFISIFFINVKNVKASNDIVVNVDYNGEWVKSQIDKNSKLIEYVETNILPAIEEKGYKYGMFINSQGIHITFLEKDTEEVNLRPAFWGDSANNKIEGKPDNTKNKVIYFYLADYEKENIKSKEEVLNWYSENNFNASQFWYNFGLGTGYYGNKKVTESFDLYDDTFKNYNNSEDYMAGKKILYKSNVKVKIMKGDAYLPLRINKGEILNEGEEFPTYKDVAEPYDNLTLKKTFNSGTNAPVMGKITWDINAYGDIKAMDGILPFKLQYGANDFKISNIPKFTSYKIYGSNSFESGWEDITKDERFYFDDFKYEKYTLEGTLTETIMKGILHIPSDMCVYENIKVEFFFENTVNFYLYAFDDMTTNFNEGWSDVEYYFKDYIKYDFPKNTRYAFISSKVKEDIKDKIYFPRNYSKNEQALFGGYLYNYKENYVMNSIKEESFKDNDYYSYFDLDFNLANNEIVFLERKTNTDEIPYFYLHKDLFVEFSSKKEVEIKTPTGWIDIDTGKIENPYSKVENAENKEINSIFDFVTSYIYKKLPIIEQIGKIYNSFQYIDGVDKPPKFNFNMSFLGLGNYMFELNFDNYRDTFFGYLKIIFSLYTVFSVLNEIKNIVNGGGGS